MEGASSLEAHYNSWNFLFFIKENKKKDNKKDQTISVLELDKIRRLPRLNPCMKINNKITMVMKKTKQMVAI